MKVQIKTVSDAMKIIKELQQVCKSYREENAVLKEKNEVLLNAIPQRTAPPEGFEKLFGTFRRK